MIQLTGEITWSTGMWSYRIYQRGLKFYLEERSDMSEQPTYSEYATLHDALIAMLSQT